MGCSKENHCIQCSVEQCKNHSTCGAYCSLDCISVGTHEANPTMDQCTDCLSLKRNNGFSTKRTTQNRVLSGSFLLRILGKCVILLLLMV